MEIFFATRVARLACLAPLTGAEDCRYEGGEQRRDVAQLEATFGWTAGRMASLYTQSADRKRLALEGMHLLENEKRKSIPSPLDQVRAPERKA